MAHRAVRAYYSQQLSDALSQETLVGPVHAPTAAQLARDVAADDDTAPDPPPRAPRKTILIAAAAALCVVAVWLSSRRGQQGVHLQTVHAERTLRRHHQHQHQHQHHGML